MQGCVSPQEDVWLLFSHYKYNTPHPDKSGHPSVEGITA